MLYLFENKWITADSSGDWTEKAVRLEDAPDTWATLLNDPTVVADKAGRDEASVLCGARYWPGSPTREKENIDCVETLVLDVDDPGESGSVPTREELETALEGLHAVIYTSASHTEQNPRWRVLLPLLSPLPPKKHRSLVAWLSENLVEGRAGCINVESTADPGRLGFVGVTMHPEDYTWWVQQGTPFDWTPIALDEEEWAHAPLGGLERSALWTDRETGLKAALKKFHTTGQGIGKGGGRTMALWEAANTLWWAFAAEDEDFVLTVLRHINSNFKEPEPEEELERKMRESHQRTIGERRREQVNGGYGWAREPENLVSIASINAHARRLKQRRSPEQALLGEALKSLAKGESVSDDPETWRGLITKLAHELARAFPTETPSRIAAFFRPSLATMRSAGAQLPSEEEIHSYIGARIHGIKKAREETQARNDAKMREEIAYVTQNERDNAYTKQEVDTWMSEGAGGVGLRNNTWLLSAGKSLYVFVNGTWAGPYVSDLEVAAQLTKDLAAARYFVQTKKINEKTGQQVNIPVPELLERYGSKCETVVDFNLERTYFDVDTKTLVLSGPKKRPLTAKFHEDVDRWLRAATGRAEPTTEKARREEAGKSPKGGALDGYDNLYDWMACLPDVSRPCAALYIDGPKDTGKNLFGQGVGRIWLKSPCKIEYALVQFNSRLLESPLVWVNEGLPAQFKASIILRDAIAATEHHVTRKRLDSNVAYGCLRLLFTANNLDLFSKNDETMSKQDVDALADRFVNVSFQKDASDWFDKIPAADRRAYLDRFVEGNAIAEHVLWLHNQRFQSVYARGHRFLIAGSSSNNVSNVVATSHPAANDCCGILLEAIIDARRLDWLAIKDNKILVQVPSFKKYVNVTKPYAKLSDKDVALAIASISDEQTRTVRHMGKVRRMRELRHDALLAWCETTAMYEPDEVLEAITKMNKEAWVREDGVLTSTEDVQ